MIKRKIASDLQNAMNEYPSVSLFGSRQCGKTTIAKELFPTYSYANLEDSQTRLLAETDSKEFFTKFPEPVIIDEIQRVPELISTIQVRIDNNHKPGQYLITGSQQISLKKAVAQSLAGRTLVMNMLPLSLEELLEANIDLDRDTQLVAGFMPFLYKDRGHSPSDFYRSYIDTYLERDIAGINAVQDLSKFRVFLKLLAGRVGQLVNNAALSGEVGVSSSTIGHWLSILEASHIIFKLQPWYTSRTSQIVKTPKIYFCDTGIAASLLGIETPSQMTRDPLLGSLFENMVVLEALKAAINTSAKDNLYFFRNSNGLEIDLIQKSGEALNLFEIKSGKALDKKFLRGMRSFRAHFSDSKDKKSFDALIYSGEDVPSFDGVRFINYKRISSFFSPLEEKFRLSF
ncbi:MAG: ATP-binding protein [Treponema sp.]|nr:ATP-binding protein [Treponema sp.]